jgi:hemin uptake protein HemP
MKRPLQLRSSLNIFARVNRIGNSSDPSCPAVPDAAGTEPPSSTGAPPTPPRVLDVAQLLAGRDEVRLLHRGQEYRLRITRQGKLILTK